MPGVACGCEGNNFVWYKDAILPVSASTLLRIAAWDSFE